MGGKDTYLLNRGTFSSIRLTAQHFLWHDHLGWNLHPAGLAGVDPRPQQPSGTEINGNESADYKPNGTLKPLVVADVACGNGLWLVQESQSRSYPPNTSFHGFDISDAQFPSPATVPANLTFSVLNASDPSHIPQEYHNAFDIVHVRLLMGAIGCTPIHFLRSFLTLLRPGGFLQWGEVDPHNSQPFPPTSTPSKWSGYIPRLITSCHPGVDMPMTWLDTLPSFFEAEGMTDIQQLRGGPPKPQMRRCWTDNDFGVLTEIASGLGPPKEVFEELEHGFKKREQEIMYEIRITTGRKALN